MPPDFFPTVALTILGADLLRYLLGAGLVWLVVNVLLGSRLAGLRILDGASRPGQMRHELAYSMSTVLVFAANGALLWLLAANGSARIYADVAEFGWVWWWVSLGLILIAHDAWFYWTHRLLHRPRVFALVHARHHVSPHPTPWAAYSFHPVEALIQAAFLPLYLLLIPTHASVIGVFLVHMILRNALGHCGHEVFPWAWLRSGALRWLTPVTHHHFHHARNGGNYGLYFTWWDRWCGTEDPDHLAYGDAHFMPAAGAARRPA